MSADGLTTLPSSGSWLDSENSGIRHVADCDCCDSHVDTEVCTYVVSSVGWCARVVPHGYFGAHV